MNGFLLNSFSGRNISHICIHELWSIHQPSSDFSSLTSSLSFHPKPKISHIILLIYFLQCKLILIAWDGKFSFEWAFLKKNLLRRCFSSIKKRATRSNWKGFSYELEKGFLIWVLKILSTTLCRRRFNDFLQTLIGIF